MKKSIAILVAAMMVLTVVGAAGIAAADNGRNNNRDNNKDTKEVAAVPVYLELKENQEQHIGPVAWAFVAPIKSLPGNFKVTRVLAADGAKDLKNGQELKLYVEFKNGRNDDKNNRNNDKNNKWGKDVWLADLKKFDGKVVLVNPKTLAVQQGVALALLNKQAILEVKLAS